MDDIYNKLEKNFRDLIEKEILTNLSFSDETSSGYMYGRGTIIRPSYMLRWKKGSAGFEGLGKDLGGFSLPEKFKSSY